MLIRRHQFRFAFGQRAGFIDDQHVDFFHHLQASAFLTSTPAIAPRPVPTMIDIGVAKPKRTGQAMINTATPLTIACANRSSAPSANHTTNVMIGDRNHRRHKPGRHHIGQPLNRRAAALGFAHHPHDLRQQRVAADALGPHHERPGAVHRAAGHAVAGLLLHRHRLAGDHRFIDAARAFEHHAVDRNFFARPHPQLVARLHVFQRHIVFAAVGFNSPGRFRRESQQARMALDVCPRARSSKHLAQQHQRDDHRGRFEINVRLCAAVAAAAISGNNPGAIVATTLKTYAAPVPMAISVNMFGERCTIDCQPRSKNGQPHHSTTGVASANCSQRSAVGPIQCFESACPAACRASPSKTAARSSPG